MDDLLLTMLKEQLDWNWIDLSDLKKDVAKGYLSPAGYKKVTGDEYVAEDAEAQSSQLAQQA